jgi:hypothetical protein
MDVLKAQADLAKLQAETMRLFADIQKTRQLEQRWLPPLLTASSLTAIVAGVAGVGAEFARLFLR